MFKCSLCPLSVESVNALFLHYKVAHQKSRNDNFRCSGFNCIHVSEKWTSFKKHLATHDMEVPVLCSTLNNIDDPQGSSVAHVTEQGEYPVTDVVDEICNDEQQPSPPSEILTPTEVGKKVERLVLSRIARLYADIRLPRCFVQETIEADREFLTHILALLKPALLEASKSMDENGFNYVLQSYFGTLSAPYHLYRSEHLRFKALAKTSHLPEALDIVVGTRNDFKIRKGNVCSEITDVTAKFLPMRDVLQKFFSVPGVLVKVKNYVQRLEEEREVFQNFVQGKLWQRKVAQHFQGKTVYPLFVYYDDFEVNNPIGAHAVVQKLGAVYYSIACLPPDVASLLDNIFVALLFFASDRSTYSNRRIFQCVLDELNYLQKEGVLVDVDGNSERIYFALGLVLGDNLGLNCILGFTEGFNANFYCRLCKVSKAEARTYFYEKNLRLTTYNDDLNLTFAETGVREPSVWNDVAFFKTAENFATDWLHEGPEGTLKEDMQHIVYHFVANVKPKTDRLSLEVLNERLKTFNYNHNAISNPPPLISEDELKNKKLKMTASEMQNFALIFALLVGDLVPHDEVWEFYLHLREILDIVLSRGLQKQCAGLLRTLIAEHHVMFVRLFPDSRLKPKAHLWVHYKTVFEESGPIINLSSARFESKHRVKKRQAHATTSRLNIVHTLMVKEQLQLCSRFMSRRGIDRMVKEGPSLLLQSVCDFADYDSIKGSLPNSFKMGPCFKLNWASVGGHTYKKGTCVVVELEENDELLPVFGFVRNLLQDSKGQLCLVCKLSFSKGFEKQLHAFEIENASILKCVPVENLYSPTPVIYDKVRSITYCSLRHAL